MVGGSQKDERGSGYKGRLGKTLADPDLEGAGRGLRFKSAVTFVGQGGGLDRGDEAEGEGAFLRLAS